MSQNTITATTGPGTVDQPVRPVAWWHTNENGNIQCWTSAHADALRLAREVGFAIEPLYDQAALDAAVAAKRERCAVIVETHNPGGSYHIRTALAEAIRKS